MKNPRAALRIGFLTIGSFIGASCLVTPALADKPKDGTVVKGVPNCKDHPPKCFVIGKAAPAAPATAISARRTAGTLKDEIAGLMVHGCWQSDGSITILNGAACKTGLDVWIVS